VVEPKPPEEPQRSRWLPPAHEVEPDDPRANDAGNYIGAGLLAFPLLALVIGLLFLPPGFAIAFIRRGVGDGRPAWIVLGALIGLGWLGFLRVIMRRVMTAKPPDEP